MTKPGLTVYEISHDKLLKRLVRAAASVGFSGSGLVIDMRHGSNVEEVQYVQGAALARLEGLTPPLTPGLKILLDENVQSIHSRGYPEAPKLELGKTYIVDRVFYDGNDSWSMTLSGCSKSNYEGWTYGRYRAEIVSPAPIQNPPIETSV